MAYNSSYKDQHSLCYDYSKKFCKRGGAAQAAAANQAIKNRTSIMNSRVVSEIGRLTELR